MFIVMDVGVDAVDIDDNPPAADAAADDANVLVVAFDRDDDDNRSVLVSTSETIIAGAIAVAVAALLGILLVCIPLRPEVLARATKLLRTDWLF